MRKFYETAVILLGTLGWWGFVYPELCLSGDRYEQETSAEEVESLKEADEEAERKEHVYKPSARETVHQEENSGKCNEEGDPDQDPETDTGLKTGDIRIKSRIAEYVYQIKENVITEKRRKNDQQKCAGRSF